MPYLLRVEIPDVPGSLGRLASAIGEAGGDIEAIEIVEKRHDGTAVDDVCSRWSTARCPTRWSRRAPRSTASRCCGSAATLAGGNLFLDLEVVESLTAEPETAPDRLVELLPVAFRCEWAARIKAVPDGYGSSTPARARPP